VLKNKIGSFWTKTVRPSGSLTQLNLLTGASSDARLTGRSRTNEGPISALVTMLLVALLSSLGVQAQDDTSRDDTPETANSGMRAVARDLGSTEWRGTQVISNSVTGEILEQESHYFELQDGLNYRDNTGNWLESKDLIEPTDDGAAAVHGPTKVHFAANLNSEGAVTIITRSNNVLRLRPLGLYYYDAQAAKPFN
jgi:hypothetical protein